MNSKFTKKNINDCHVHLGQSGPWIPGSNPSTTAIKVVQLMDKYNIEKAVVFPNPLPGSKYPEANNYIISSVLKYPERLIGFGRIDPRYGLEIIPEIERLANNGITGIKLHPIVECFCPDHSYFVPVYEAIVKSGIRIILVHSSNSGFAEATRWISIANKFPQLTIILAHLNEACLPLLKRFDNIYVDTSASSSQLIEKACEIDASKVLFGSDHPYIKWEQEFEKVTQINCSIGVKEKILFKNFLEVFINGRKNG